MEIVEIMGKKRELEASISELLEGFKQDTGVNILYIGFQRRVCYDNYGGTICKDYDVDVEIDL